MRRAPIVIAGTVAGLIAVLEFHTTPPKVTLAGGATLPSAAGSTSATSKAAAGRSTSADGASPDPTSASASPSARASASSSAGTSAATRTATGPRVNYNFGVLSVKVTVSGSKISKVGIAYLDDSDSPRSEMIDQDAIPILEQEALQAQSANIQSVSGASYTSAGFTSSLQSALRSLGI
jgi:uncharacterized protein with FMN-binding domain